MSNNIPIYPEFDTKTLADDAYGFMTNTVAVRIETRVPHEFWEEFKQRMGIRDELPPAPQKGITNG